MTTIVETSLQVRVETKEHGVVIKTEQELRALAEDIRSDAMKLTAAEKNFVADLLTSYIESERIMRRNGGMR